MTRDNLYDRVAQESASIVIGRYSTSFGLASRLLSGDVKQHIENIYALSREQAGDVHEAARRVALAMKRAYSCDGVSTRQHNEPAGQQEVWHYHLHVFPRYDGDELYTSPARLTTLDERVPYAAALRDAL